MWLVLSVVLPYLVKKLKAYAAKKNTETWKNIEAVLIKVQRVLSVL